MLKLDNSYALIIGVDFKQKTPQPARDAKSIYDVISDETLCGYKKENITLLLDTEATTDKIIKALDEIIEKTNKNSSFLLYYSGHGGYHDKKSFLLPFGASSENLVKGAVLREKLSQMKSKRMFILFDCCHSAGFFDGKDDIISQTISNNITGDIFNTSSTLEGIAQEIDDEQGMVIMTSSQAEEESWGDFINDDYSVFTTCLIEAFTGIQLINANHIEEANTYFNKIIARESPAASESYLAQAYYYIEDYLNAQDIYKVLHEKESDNIEYLVQLAICYSHNGNFEEAKTYIEKLDALRTDYQFGAVDYGWAQYYAAVGDKDTALEFLLKAVSQGYNFTPSTFQNDLHFRTIKDSPKFNNRIMNYWKNKTR